MSEQESSSIHRLHRVEPACFGWRAGPTVILAFVEGDALVVSRCWPEADRLLHPRRWVFREPRPFLGQIRRLVRDFAIDSRETEAAVEQARTWLIGCSIFQ